MSRKQFIKKIATRAIVLTILLVVIVNFLGAFGTIISNELALGQMENSNEMYLLMELYNNTIKPVGYVLIIASSLIIATLTAMDTYKFIKTKEKNENEKEL